MYCNEREQSATHTIDVNNIKLALANTYAEIAFRITGSKLREQFILRANGTLLLTNIIILVYFIIRILLLCILLVIWSVI